MTHETVWRHGHRTPTSFIPTDVINNGPNTWPYGPGELTKLGMTQHFRLGKMIADRYVKEYGLLDLNYSNHMLYIHSDDYNRTLSSAYGNLAGFFINTSYYSPKYENWPNFWNPIPVHTIDKFRDSVNC
ncbi:unnamed protein product [Soboliphyme baturini]|uniref:Sulfatase domain-containing protein n=1 Tax=Soboliphyme baturini TaxID=241478 RepID=A0A183J2U0_9BILA|nr:unnamed protein product [Soboliphyme baturini]